MAGTRLRVGACLSLSGKFARFGRQAARGLEAWRQLDGNAALVIEDDRSDRRTLESLLPAVAGRSDILLGPYSTILMRAAGRMAADAGWLVWNQGGSGDDAERGAGHVVPVLTPAARYAAPFVRYLNGGPARRTLCVVHGPGRFGRQVAGGAASLAADAGITVLRAESGSFPPADLPDDWDLFSAGVFEQDAALVNHAAQLPRPPRRVCTIAAGVRDFADVADDPDGAFGIAQWFAGRGHEAMIGPDENTFLRVYGAAPDYPAVQAAAGAVLGAHCARLAGSTRREALWAAASGLDTSTLFGAFRIDPADGQQVAHETVLVRWTGGQPEAVPAPV